METSASNEYHVDLKVPFPTKRHAEIAYDVLRIDAEPKRSSVTKTLHLEDNTLAANFTADLAKHIRVSVNAFFEALILCTETMDQFGPVAKSYDFN